MNDASQHDAPDVNTEFTRELARRADNLFLPVYPQDSEDANKFECPEDERTALDAALGEGASIWPASADDAVLAVFLQFCRLMPKLNLVNASHDPNTADWHWAKARCVLAGAGHVHHAALANLLRELYPLCPMRPDESRETWTTALRQAHLVCGWPISLGLCEWSRTVHALRQQPKNNPAPQWVALVALFHLLKHVRMSARSGITICYKNTTARFLPDERSNVIATAAGLRQSLLAALGAPVAEKDGICHPLTAALDRWLKLLTQNDLIYRRPLSQLPGTVLAGPWSTIDPDPIAVHGFIQHGVRLGGVWVAHRGRVAPATGDTDDIMGVDWELDPHIHTPKRSKFELSLPTVYDDKVTPFELLRWCFPNIRPDTHGGDPRAVRCLFDAIMCAGMLRTELPALALEKPLLLCMPTTPGLDESTNQGKSKCAHTIAQALTPGIPLSGISDTESAPDQRAIAGTIALFGSLCADEWRQPRKKSHVLSHENLQMLLTGGEVVVGQAYANQALMLRLHQPIVAACKAMDPPPDIINRAFVLLLDPLTDEQRARGDLLDEVESGRLSVRMRLSALAMCERLKLAEKLQGFKPGSSSKGWRFNMLRAIAAELWKDAFGEGGEEALDLAIMAMQAGFAAHTREAEQTGLLTSLEEGHTVKVRLHALFCDLTPADMRELLVECRAREDDPRGFSPTAVLKARAKIANLGYAPLARLNEFLGGRKVNVSDRSMAQAFAREVRNALPIGSRMVLPELLGLAGYFVERGPDNNGSPRLQFGTNAPATHTPKPGI